MLKEKIHKHQLPTDILMSWTQALWLKDAEEENITNTNVNEKYTVSLPVFVYAR